MKKSETLQVNISELNQYVDKSEDKSNHPVTNWMSLRSQVQVDGLKSLHNALGKGTTLSLQELKNQHGQELLHDLEMVSKRQEGNNNRNQLPPFKKEFYDELNKPNPSKAYHEFLDAYSKRGPSTHIIEAISAKALLDFNNPNITSTSLKTNFQSNLSSYKQEYAAQTTKDMERAVIGFKGPDGVIRELTVDELKNSKEIGLSGEQKEFILTSWQQGSFESGWLSGHSNPGATAKGLSSANTSDRTQIFIDLSENEVKVHNRIASKLSSPDMEDKIDYVGGTLTVDITNMKGDSFMPGCATVEPKIEIQLTNLSDVAFDLPEKLKVEKKSNAEVFEKIKELGIETNLSAVTNNSSKTKIAQIVLKEVLGQENALQRIQEHKQDKVFEQIKAANLPAPARGETIQVELNKDPSLAENSPNPKSHQRAVDLYCKAEKNPVLREQFAMKRLDGFLKAHDNNDLNKEKVTKLKEGVVGILTPLCQDKNKEVPIIEKNAEKLIRECAAKVNKTTSLSQAWQKFKDKATNVIANLRGKSNKVKDLLSQYPGMRLFNKLCQSHFLPF